MNPCISKVVNLAVEAARNTSSRADRADIFEGCAIILRAQIAQSPRFESTDEAFAADLAQAAETIREAELLQTLIFTEVRD